LMYKLYRHAPSPAPEATRFTDFRTPPAANGLGLESKIIGPD
jgi:hypothetical protein